MMARSPRLDPSVVKNLLVRSANWIGDAVMTTPALAEVRRLFCNAAITVLAKPLVAPIFENSPRVDRVFIYDGEGRHKGVAGKLRLAAELSKEGFDAALLFQNAFEAAFITAVAGIPVRIGFNTDARGLLLTHPVKNPKRYKQGHHVDYYLGILRGLGFDVARGDLELHVGEKDRTAAEGIIVREGLAGKRLLGVSPGATFGPAKQWHPERYAELIDRLCLRADLGVVILGGPGDAATAERIAGLARTQVVNLCGRTSVGEAIALVGMCGLFVTNDSGLMHVAAALGVPLAAVFGSTDPVATGPLGARSRVVQVKLPCNPCLKPECPEGHLDCMNRVTVDMVEQAVFSLAPEIFS